MFKKLFASTLVGLMVLASSVGFCFDRPFWVDEAYSFDSQNSTLTMTFEVQPVGPGYVTEATLCKVPNDVVVGPVDEQCAGIGLVFQREPAGPIEFDQFDLEGVVVDNTMYLYRPAVRVLTMEATE